MAQNEVFDLFEKIKFPLDSKGKIFFQSRFLKIKMTRQKK